MSDNMIINKKQKLDSFPKLLIFFGFGGWGFLGLRGEQAGEGASVLECFVFEWTRNGGRENVNLHKIVVEKLHDSHD